MKKYLLAGFFACSYLVGCEGAKDNSSSRSISSITQNSAYGIDTPSQQTRIASSPKNDDEQIKNLISQVLDETKISSHPSFSISETLNMFLMDGCQITYEINNETEDIDDYIVCIFGSYYPNLSSEEIIGHGYLKYNVNIRTMHCDFLETTGYYTLNNGSRWTQKDHHEMLIVLQTQSINAYIVL